MSKQTDPFHAEGLLWEYYQNTLIDDAIRDTGQVDQRVAVAQDRIKSLEDRLDRLALLCVAAWSLLQERAKVTEKELLDRMRQIDLSDGRVNDKAKKIVRCAKCKAVMSVRHTRCVYCGQQRLHEAPFEEIF